MRSELHCLVCGMQPTDNLAVSGRARKVACEVYRVTGLFPANERFGLTAQMRRAAVSIGSNIAEGCGRHGDRELAAFLQIAMGSASELEFQIELAVDLMMLSAEGASALRDELEQLMRMLARLIVSLRAAIDKAPKKRNPATSRPAD